MYISRVTWRRDAPLTHLIRGDYDVHSAMWGLFAERPAGSQRPFLYRREDRQGVPAFIVVSEEAPAPQNAHWHVETKRYTPQLHCGQELAFVLRANPIRRRRRDDGRQVRHDVVMDERKRLEAEGRDVPHRQDLVQAAGTQWLAERADGHGFRLYADTCRIERYQQHRIRKPGGTAVQLSTVDYQGRLEVTDVDAFVRTLSTGIGPAKSFGCGLLLVRRV